MSGPTYCADCFPSPVSPNPDGSGGVICHEWTCPSGLGRERLELMARRDAAIRAQTADAIEGFARLGRELAAWEAAQR